MDTGQRQTLIERFLPRSKCNIAATLPIYHETPNGQMFNHLLVSRALAFRTPLPVQAVSLYFSDGIEDTGLSDYQVHYGLDPHGNILTMVEMVYEGELGQTAIPKYYIQGQTDAWQMETIVTQSDNYLSLLTTHIQLPRLPLTHRLMRQLRVRREDSLEGPDF